MSNNQIKVLICNNTTENSVKTASKLREFGIFAYTRKNDMDLLFNSIINDTPDVVVADLTLKDVDTITLMKKSKNILTNCPNFIIVSEIKNSFIERQVMENGASYFLPKPYDETLLASVIKSIVRTPEKYGNSDIELNVTNVMLNFGIPAHIKGYRYLRTAILITIKNQDMIGNITKKLYPYIAEEYDTTPSRVERAIRTAIEIAWNRGNEEELRKFFGYTVDTMRGKPTNSEFIALVTDKLIMQIRRSFLLNNDEM